MNNLGLFMKRMKSINIKLECSINYPWVYIDKINGKRVKEKYFSEHKYTIALETSDKFFKDHLGETFSLIRKYI